MKKFYWLYRNGKYVLTIEPAAILLNMVVDQMVEGEVLAEVSCLSYKTKLITTTLDEAKNKAEFWLSNILLEVRTQLMGYLVDKMFHFDELELAIPCGAD